MKNKQTELIGYRGSKGKLYFERLSHGAFADEDGTIGSFKEVQLIFRLNGEKAVPVYRRLRTKGSTAKPHTV